MKAAVVENITSKPDQNSSEILELVKAAGYSVVVHYEVELDPPHSHQYLPEMKLDRLKHLLEEKDIDKIIFSEALKPHMVHALEDELDEEIIDKPVLILEIFEKKANSLDIKLQVQLAQLKYSMPKMTAKLSEAVETEKAGFGAGGEQVTDVMISDMKSRIRTLERRINEIKNKASTRFQEDVPRLPIIGYYSAGKSTLFNMLTTSTRETGAEAFTTMILKTSRSTITGYPLDLIDTVGLVELPKNIISAFDLMLTEIFSFSGVVLCLNSTLSMDRWKTHLQDYLDYVDRFAGEIAPKMIIVLTKADLVSVERLQEYRSYLSGEDFEAESRVIETRVDQMEASQQAFITAFEDLFEDQLLEFHYQHLQPGTASRIHNVARIESQEWHNDGTTTLTGVGPLKLLNELKGEIFQ